MFLERYVGLRLRIPHCIGTASTVIQIQVSNKGRGAVVVRNGPDLHKSDRAVRQSDVFISKVTGSNGVGGSAAGARRGHEELGFDGASGREGKGRNVASGVGTTGPSSGPQSVFRIRESHFVGPVERISVRLGC